MAKKNEVLKKRSFKDLAKYKKVVPVYFENEEIFRVQELNGSQLSDFIKILIENITEPTDSTTDGTFGVSSTSICWLLRNMIIGFDDIKSISDEDLISTLNETGTEVQSQVTAILKDMVFNKVEKMFAQITESLPKEDVNDEKAAE